MRKTKYYTSGFLIVFLMLYIISLNQTYSSTAYYNNIILSSDDNADSWSRKIKSGPQLSNFFIEIIDNHTYVIGSIGEYYTRDDIYLAKFDSSGAKVWEQTWDGAKYEHIKGYAIDTDNNIYITGISNLQAFYSGIAGSIFLLKYNTNGNLLWSKTLDPVGSNEYWIHSIQTDLNDSIYISSATDTYSIYKALITKLNSSGNVFWTQVIELSGGLGDFILDSVGNMYLYDQRHRNLNSTLIKLNASGSRQWDYNVGDLYCDHMKIDFEDNIFLTGDLSIMKINTSGNLTEKIVCASEGSSTPFRVWFLDNIFVLIGSSLFEYNYSLDSKWNFTFGNEVLIERTVNFKFGITSDHKMYLIYGDWGDLTILRFNSSGTILSNFKWGGSYQFRLFDIIIDNQDNLYMVCMVAYENIWNENTFLAFLVKNPKIDLIALYLEQLIEDGEIFIFSLFGVACFISVVLVFTTLKPKHKHK